MTQKELLALLSQYGISENESRVYLGLLKYGHSTVMELSNRLRMNRSTVHMSSNSLIEKGLVSQVKYGERRMLIPETVEKISILIENEKLNLKRKEENLDFLTKSVDDYISNASDSTKSVVKYIQGKKTIARLYDRILESPIVRAYYTYTDLTQVFPENKEKFIKASLEKGVITRDIVIDNSGDTNKYEELPLYKASPLLQFRLLPAKSESKFIDYLIYDGEIAIVYMEEIPKAIIISNQMLFENATVVFDYLWSIL